MKGVELLVKILSDARWIRAIPFLVVLFLSMLNLDLISKRENCEDARLNRDAGLALCLDQLGYAQDVAEKCESTFRDEIFPVDNNIYLIHAVSINRANEENQNGQRE